MQILLFIDTNFYVPKIESETETGSWFDHLQKLTNCLAESQKSFVAFYVQFA